MAKRSMVLFRMPYLTPSKKALQSKEHPARGCRERDTKGSITKLEITGNRIAGGYFEAKITHREGTAIEGYWHEQRIHEVAQLTTLPVYYNRDRQIFIVEGPHSIVTAAVRRLGKDCKEDITLAGVRIDFDAVLRKRHHLSVRGAWASNPSQPIRSRAAFSGTDLQQEPAFKEMRAAGLSNLSLNYPFDEAGEELRVNISRSCAAFFLEQVDLKVRLQFMEHLAGFEKIPTTAKRGAA